MYKILISDDNKDFLDLLDSLLRSQGYGTHVTHDGGEAIAHLKENQDYDLLITDIIMPGTDGFDLIDYVRNNLDIKIIAVSGGGVLLSSKSAVKTIEDQVDASLEKPVEMDELLQCVEDVLKK